MAFDFDGIENAEVFERGSYLPPDGVYYLKVNRTLTKDTQRSGPAFIAEFTVIHSEHDAVTDGQKKSWFQGLKDKNVAFPAILEFMAALLGIDVKDKEAFDDFKGKIKPILKEAGNYDGPDEDHPLHGETIKVTTWSKETNAGKDFTVHDWAIWSEEDGFE
jgi:hypothetical protein